MSCSPPAGNVLPVGEEAKRPAKRAPLPALMTGSSQGTRWTGSWNQAVPVSRLQTKPLFAPLLNGTTVSFRELSKDGDCVQKDPSSLGHNGPSLSLFPGPPL